MRLTKPWSWISTCYGLASDIELFVHCTHPQAVHQMPSPMKESPSGEQYVDLETAWAGTAATYPSRTESEIKQSLFLKHPTGVRETQSKKGFEIFPSKTSRFSEVGDRFSETLKGNGGGEPRRIAITVSCCYDNRARHISPAR